MIIWDTDPLFASADVDDRDHSRCAELMWHTPVPLLMPIPVLTEVGYLLERENGGRDRHLGSLSLLGGSAATFASVQAPTSD